MNPYRPPKPAEPQPYRPPKLQAPIEPGEFIPTPRVNLESLLNKKPGPPPSPKPFLGPAEERLDPVYFKIRDLDRTEARKGPNSFSRQRNPPPGTVLSQEQYEQIVAPRVKWHERIIPGLRQSQAPQTILYARCSTDKQLYSIETQVAAFERYVTQNQVSRKMPPVCPLHFLDADTSGKVRFIERRWGGQLIRYIRPGDHVYTAHYDRLGRDQADIVRTITLLAQEFHVHVHIEDLPWLRHVDPDNPLVQFQLQSMASAVELERNLTSARNKEAVRYRLLRGVVPGGEKSCPLRYIPVPNPDFDPTKKSGLDNPRFLAKYSAYENSAIEAIYDKWLDGWTICEICTALRKHGIMRGSGKPWTAHAVRRAIELVRSERGKDAYLPPKGQ